MSDTHKQSVMKISNGMDYIEFRKEFFALVEESTTIVITAHFSPDDDSIASVLSVYTILTTKYPEKNIRIIYTGTSVTRYNIFFNYDKIEFVDDIAQHIAGTDLLIILDVNRFTRISKMPESIIELNISKTIAIDHHGTTPDTFTLSLIAPEISSNAELIYHALVEGETISKDLASYFLLGILGDTGNFSYVLPQQSPVFTLAKNLIDQVGMSIELFRSRYGGIPKRVIPLIQELVKNTSYEKIGAWEDFQYSFIDRKTIQEGRYSDEEISTASHIYIGQYVLRVEGYRWGFVITPRTDGSARMSSRSLPGSINVRDFHERLGIGGGHDRASGGEFKKATTDREPKECITEVLEWMKNNDPVIG